MAKIETFVDNFDVQQPWWGTFDNVAWVDGRLRIESSSPYPGVSTWPIPPFDLTDSAIFIEMEPAPAAATRQSFMALVGPAGGNELIIGVTDEVFLMCRATINGVGDQINLPYDPVAMRYVRLRHTGSTVFWETAPTGSGPWTVRRQMAPPWSITDVQVRLTAGNWGGLPGGLYAWFDNLNYIEAPPAPEELVTFTAGRQWALGYAHGHRITSLWKAGRQIFDYQPPPTPPLTNLISNGSFEADTTGWTGSLTLSRQALGVPHGEFGSWRGQNAGTVNGAHWLQRSAALPVVSSRRYYLRARVATATATMGNIVQFANTTTALTGAPSLTLTPVNSWQVYDMIWTANTASLTLRVNFTGGSGNQARQGWLDNMMIIDLTDTFGAGNEPDIEDIREVVADGGGYWDGTWDPST